MYSARPPYLVARTRQLELLVKARTNAQNSKGSFVCVTGETGYGKTVLLESFSQESQRMAPGVEVVHIDCSQPIGNMNVGAIQPMQPFIKVLETLMERSSAQAKKKLAMNIGLSVLGLIPFAGQVFDVTKEIMRDLREYKRDKVKNPSKDKKGDQVVNEFFNAVRSYAEHKPLVIMLDDAQWMDAQSVELLERFVIDIHTLPLVIVLAFQRATAEAKNPPLAAWIHEHTTHPHGVFNDLPSFSMAEISECCSMFLHNYRKDTMLEQWLNQRSAGIPATVCEYLNYFQNHSPYRADGTLDTNFLQSNIVPASLKATFSKNIEQLSEDDRNILALCSAEGREFTAFVISKLMNTDLLACIRKLKSLQQRTGIIRSLGAHARYGVKTTVYEFTQALHYTYFHSTLEFEEKNELHNRIARILQHQYDEALNEDFRHQIAPYIAAHSMEAGDSETARAMLLESAHLAEESGSKEVLEEAFHVFEELESGDPTPEEEREIAEFDAMLSQLDAPDTPPAEEAVEQVETSVRPPRVETSQVDVPDVGIVRDDILEYFFRGEFEQAALRAIDFVEVSGQHILPADRALLLTMAARAHTENGRLTQAHDLCHQARNIIAEFPDGYAECLLFNTMSVLAMHENHVTEAWKYLQHAARVAMDLSEDTRLLTVSNISLLLKESNPRHARMFERAAKSLCQSLHFSTFYNEVFRH